MRAESGKGCADAWGGEEAARLMESCEAAARADPVARGTGGPHRTENPRGSARKTPECARNVRKTLHDKEDNADPVRCSPAVRPSSGVCGRSGYTRLSVSSLFTDRPCVVRSNMLGGGRGQRATVAVAAGQAGRNHRTMRAMRA